MKIECKLKRKGGTHVPLGTASYHFAPDADDVHVCDVTDEAHQDVFLGITEAYRLYRKGQAAPTIEQLQPKPVAAPVAPVVSPAERESLKFPDTFTIGAAEFSLADVIVQAMQANDMDIDLWADLTVEEQSAKIEAQLDAMQDAVDAAAMEALMATKDDGPDDTGKSAFDDGAGQSAAAPVAASDERAALVEQYQKLNGKKPHHKWDNAKIRAEIAKG